MSLKGYENEDWYIGNPVISADENIDLTDEQIEETLDYFVLCSERLSQMTKTYNDIDAVTGLLTEKERDLELAAHIGQSLLSQKNELKLKNKHLEAELASANDHVVKLHEELSVACEATTRYIDEHYEIGELYMEFMKDGCTRKLDESCATCSQSGWIGPQMKIIPRSFPDESTFKYKSVFESLTESSEGLLRPPGDFMPRAKIKTWVTRKKLESEHVEEFSKMFLVTQLKHDLSVKAGLLQIYTQDLEHSDPGSPETPLPDKRVTFSSWDNVNVKIRDLEDENRKLREETADLHTETADLEAKENHLVAECVRELSETNFQVRSLAEELAKKAEDNIRQQEEITYLLSQVVELQKNVRMSSAQNQDLESHLHAAQESEKELTEELIDLKEKYDEILEMLQEARDELKNHHKKSTPHARTGYYGSSGIYSNFNSLASEIESCLSHDSDFGESYSSDDRRSHSSRVFDTVKRAKPKRHNLDESSESTPAHQSYIKPSRPINRKHRNHLSDSESINTDESYSSSPNYNNKRSSDLEAALKKLSLRRRTEHEYQVAKHERMENSFSDPRVFAPDSIMSTGHNFGEPSPSQNKRRYQFPEKLQIVKPIEGSATLLKWQKLATPHLGCLSEVRPGVMIKGDFRSTEVSEIHSLSECEEEEDYSYPGKVFVDTSSIYTYTVSTVMHPSYNKDQLTSSVPITKISTTSALPSVTCSVALSSETVKPKAEGVPTSLPYISGTSTFTTNSSLAKLLQERENMSSLNKNIPISHVSTHSSSYSKNNAASKIMPTFLTNTLNFIGLSSSSKTGEAQVKVTKEQLVTRTDVGLGLISVSTPRSIFTRTMIPTSKSFNQQNNTNSDERSCQPCNSDANKPDKPLSAHSLTLNLMPSVPTQLTCINPDSPQEFSPSSTIGTVNGLAKLRKGGLFC
ncbi:Trafficking kinesin-binding protein 1 [Nymphon striatum]|nr:Trafficking kinesin-binding protein 1 [Nymphon striatum]